MKLFDEAVLDDWRRRFNELYVRRYVPENSDIFVIKMSRLEVLEALWSLHKELGGKFDAREFDEYDINYILSFKKRRLVDFSQCSRPLEFFSILSHIRPMTMFDFYKEKYRRIDEHAVG